MKRQRPGIYTTQLHDELWTAQYVNDSDRLLHMISSFGITTADAEMNLRKLMISVNVQRFSTVLKMLSG